MEASRPTLWQLEASHYSEKVRWALETTSASPTGAARRSSEPISAPP